MLLQGHKGTQLLRGCPVVENSQDEKDQMLQDLVESCRHQVIITESWLAAYECQQV